MIPQLVRQLGISVFILSISISSLAGQVEKIKNNKVLIGVEGEDISVGSQVFLLNAQGKKTALVKISSIKNEKAIGVVVKGHAQVGQQTQISGAAKITESTQNENPPPREISTVVRNQHHKLTGGVLLGYAMDTMSLTVLQGTNQESASLKGTAISLKAFGDYHYSESFTLRGAAGFEPFKTSGSISQSLCTSSNGCQASFNYLSVDGTVQYNLMQTNTRVWIGLGYAFLLEMSKSVNIPNLQADGKVNQMLLFGGGADIALAHGSYVPVSIEYGMFPGSSNVTAKAIILRSGYGMNF